MRVCGANVIESLQDVSTIAECAPAALKLIRDRSLITVPNLTFEPNLLARTSTQFGRAHVVLLVVPLLEQLRICRGNIIEAAQHFFIRAVRTPEALVGPVVDFSLIIVALSHVHHASFIEPGVIVLKSSPISLLSSLFHWAANCGYSFLSIK